ncbi:hypermethylated in cancer 1 protein isoform X2 [Callorhinchus milii]|nr:hypermethylated in cancer 1 protein isoform X2 [Callorhinchus milii]
MEVPNYAKQLLMQLNRQRTKGFLCDVIIVVQNALFRAHKNILAASSVYLKSLVVHDNLVNLDPEMVSPGIFRTILDYIYTGRLTEGDQGSEQNLGAVLAAASYLQLPDLVALCKKKLKRNGTYLHIRTGFSSYGKIGRGLRTSTPVIQSCYSVASRLMDGQPMDVMHTINTHSGELYAPASQANQAHPQRICLQDQVSSQMLGLDLSKKSPAAPSSLHQDEEPRQLSPTTISASLITTNGASYKDQPPPGSGHQLDADEQMGGHENYVFRSSLSNSDSKLRTEAQEDLLMARWLKQEPHCVDDCDRDKVAKCEHQDRKVEVPNTQVRYPNLGCEEAEDEKSSSEDTSSDDPCPSGLDRYHCSHVAYEPENFGDNLYVCIPCGKGFPSSEQLNAHVESHTEEDLFHKEVADQTSTPFLDKSNQTLGEIIRPYRCTSCEKSYKDPATLRQHEKTHWLTRPYPCNICGKKFTQRGTMTRHMRSHLGLKPFACEACGMRFTRQYRLTEHMRIHSGEKPYECQICGGKFAQQRNLISHMKMHTSGPDLKPKMDFTENVYPLAKFAAEHLGINQEKAAEILSQASHLTNNDSKAIDVYSPP